MARITVEDCLDKVDNRFELVMVSSKRSRQIQTGGRDPLVSVDNDKPTVLALREIAEGLVDASILLARPPGIVLEEMPTEAEEEISAEASDAVAATDEDAAEQPAAQKDEKEAAVAEA